MTPRSTSSRRTPLALALATLVALALTASPVQAAGTETLKLTVSGSGAGYVQGSGIFCFNGETCEALYESNAVLILTAHPSERSTPPAWTGCEENPSPTECKVRINTGTETDVKAEFSALTQQKLTVSNPGSGLGGGRVTGTSPGGEFSEIFCGNGAETCEAEYNQGTKVTLTAHPSERSTFTAWEAGDCKSESGPGNDECKVEMTEARAVKAEFAPIPQQTLKVAVQGAGAGIITYSRGGEFGSIDCGSGATSCTETYNQGAKIVLTATPTERSTFAGWSGGVCSGTAPTCEIEMTEAKSVNAEFTAISQEKLTVATEGAGSVAGVAPGPEFIPIECGNGLTTCEAEYNENATISLTAHPNADNHFKEWEGACTGTEPACKVTMTAAKSVKAIFAPTLHKLFLTPSGSGSVSATSPASGIVNCSTGGGACAAEYQEGSSVVLKATPAPHSEFLAWGAGRCIEEPTPTECEVKIGFANAEVKAEFGPIRHTLIAVPTGGGSVSAGEGAISACTHGGGVCSGDYDEASTVTLTATPMPHYSFKEWGQGQCKEIPNPTECKVEIGLATTEVDARFTPNTHTLTVTPVGPGSVKATSGAIDQCTEGDGTCSGPYVEAATVTLTATPAPHQAVAWSGCTHSAANTCEVEIGASDTAIQATFAQIVHALTIHKAGTGTGQVTCNGAPCASAYPEGTALTLTATPTSGSTFAGWSGAGCSGTGACKVTLDSDTSLTANFNANLSPPAEEKCVVPELAGKTLAQARTALTAAHCTLGTVTKPKRRKHRSLVVKSSSPAPGTTLPADSKVNLALGPKPKPTHSKKKH